ncbi:MAG: hypothetical protein LBR21_08835 [Propionibacteriaceae bacterium]|nr:hypothetical protein [Propionibacteriaceae bacterium]
MSNPRVVQILEDLAAGKVSPEEAGALIDEAQAEPDPQWFASEPESDTTTSSNRIAIKASARRVTITSDPSIATVHVDGPHSITQDGDVLEIASEVEGPNITSFSFENLQRALVDYSRDRRRGLRVRVNPSVLLDIDVTGCSLNCTGVRELNKVRVVASSAEFADIERIDDAVVTASSATIAARPTAGRSRIRCESGQLSLKLERGSSVTVKADVQLGAENWIGSVQRPVGEPAVIGNGDAELELAVVMGKLDVQVDQ